MVLGGYLSDPLKNQSRGEFMEIFWKIIDAFKKYVAGSALQSFAVIDWIILGALFWGLVSGSRKGVVDMFGKLIGIFFVSILTVSFYPFIAEHIVMLIPALPMGVAKLFAFILCGVCLWLIIYSGINFVARYLKLDAQGLFKTLGGIFFGVLHMLILLSFLFQFLLFFPFDSVQNSFKQGRTYTGYTIARIVPSVQEFVVSFICDGPLHSPISKKKLMSHKIGK